jgi:hypothetical protein
MWVLIGLTIDDIDGDEAHLSGRFGSDGVLYINSPVANNSPPEPLNIYPIISHCHNMSSHHEDIHTVKSFTEHTDVVHEESSVGKKVGEGVQYDISHRPPHTMLTYYLAAR